ncbi:hypothetical protein GEMRC1_001589 [Eukaryota sp. GEM-RC1]
MPFILNLLLMEFVVIRFYFASERYSIRILMRIVVAPCMIYVSETFARIAIRRICSDWQDREAEKQTLLNPFSIHSVIKLLVLRLLVANAGNFAETTYLILFSTFFEVIWRTTNRSRDDFFERVFVTSKISKSSKLDLDSLKKIPDIDDKVSLNFSPKVTHSVRKRSITAQVDQVRNHVNNHVIGNVSPHLGELPNAVVDSDDQSSDQSTVSFIFGGDKVVDFGVNKTLSDSEVSEVLSEIEESNVKEGDHCIDCGSAADSYSLARTVSCAEMKTFAEESLSDFDLFYHQIALFDVVFDVAAIF